jgi:hypothetical protein
MEKVAATISYKSAKKLFESPAACPLLAFFFVFLPAKVSTKSELSNTHSLPITYHVFKFNNKQAVTFTFAIYFSKYKQLLKKYP